MKNIKSRVLSANKLIVEKELVSLTWGNASAKQGADVVIKPSGIDLRNAQASDMSHIDMLGNHVAGLKPSVDAPSHIALYQRFSRVAGIVHTHSKYATVFAQLGEPIRCFGTTHADYFRGTIPIVPIPAWDENRSYEEVTGNAITSYFNKNNLDYLEVPAALIQGHGVFAWGESIEKAVENAHVLELIAEMAYMVLVANPNPLELDKDILDKHFFRKNGDNSYYGQ